MLDEPPAGESAFTDALERASQAAVPDHLQVSAASLYWGTHADCRTFALVRAARALRLKFLGKDACLHRKIPKKRQGAQGDPAWLVTSGRYADEALATVSARAPEQYAGLRPQALYGHELTRLQSNYFWQWEAYLEAALLDEMTGNIDRARHRIGQAKFYAALQDPTHTRDFTLSGLVECVARVGAVNTPLDEA